MLGFRDAGQYDIPLARTGLAEPAERFDPGAAN